jgi:SAM-dependent methyltransferase
LRHITSSRSFQKGIENPIVTMEEPAEFIKSSEYFRDNGFSSKYAMDRSHRPIIDLVGNLLRGLSSPPKDRLRVLDLGCGNGALVRKLADLHPAVVPAGVDLSPEKIFRAQQWHRRFAGEFRVASLFDADIFDGRGSDCDDNYLTILMLGRLIEVPRPIARQFLERLRGRTHHILVYAYDDYLQKFGPLARMAADAGIRLLDPDPGKNLSLAEVDSACGQNVAREA